MGPVELVLNNRRVDVSLGDRTAGGDHAACRREEELQVCVATASLRRAGEREAHTRVRRGERRALEEDWTPSSTPSRAGE